MTDQEAAFMSRRWTYRLPLLISALLGVALLVILDLQPYFEYQSKASRIRKLISIDSNIDDAGSILKANGFAYYEKHFSTVAEDAYWIDVEVAFKPRPFTLTLLHVVGLRLYFHWVVIESGIDNKVRKIF